MKIETIEDLEILVNKLDYLNFPKENVLNLSKPDAEKLLENLKAFFSNGATSIAHLKGESNSPSNLVTSIGIGGYTLHIFTVDDKMYEGVVYSLKDIKENTQMKQ